MYNTHIYMCKIVRLDIYVESLHNIVICVKECYDMLCLDDVRSKPSALRDTLQNSHRLAACTDSMDLIWSEGDRTIRLHDSNRCL